MPNEPKTIIEKYCPVVGRNIAIETTLNNKGKSGCCLNLHDCEKSHGGCTNKLFENK